MISFLNDQVRTEFHLLSIDQQRSFLSTAETLEKTDQTLTILFVDRINERTSEVTVRLDQKFNAKSGSIISDNPTSHHIVDSPQDEINGVPV